MNIPVSAYYSSEVDKYAMAVAKYRYPKTIQVGDRVFFDRGELDKIEASQNK